MQTKPANGRAKLGRASLPVYINRLPRLSALIGKVICVLRSARDGQLLGIIQMSPVAQKKFSLPGKFFEHVNYEYFKQVGHKYRQIL